MSKHRLKLSELPEMEAADKIALAIELLESAGQDSVNTSGIYDLSEEEINEYQRRADEFKNNPEIGISWETIKSQLRL